MMNINLLLLSIFCSQMSRISLNDIPKFANVQHVYTVVNKLPSYIGLKLKVYRNVTLILVLLSIAKLTLKQTANPKYQHIYINSY